MLRIRGGKAQRQPKPKIGLPVDCVAAAAAAPVSAVVVVSARVQLSSDSLSFF